MRSDRPFPPIDPVGKTNPTAVPYAVIALTLSAVLLFGSAQIAPAPWSRFQLSFLTILLGAVPFFLLGAVVAGFIDTFLSAAQLQAMLPSKASHRFIFGAFLGLLIPAGELGTILVARKLLEKKCSQQLVLPYLLIAPTFSLLTLAGTQVAFNGRWLLGRATAALFIALCLSAAMKVWPHWLDFRVQSNLAQIEPDQTRPTRITQIWHAFVSASADFLSYFPLVVVGTTAAALTQIWLPPEALLSAARSPLNLLLLSFLHPLNAAADALWITSFLNLITPGGLLAFFSFGSVMDLLNLLLLSAVFKPRSILKLAAALLLLNFALALLVNGLT